MEFKTTIGRAVLLEKLGQNRARYVDTRKTLIEVYKKKEEEYLKARAEYSAKIYAGTLTGNEEKPFAPFIPQDRTDTYDMYIAMVDRHCGDTLEIDHLSFRSLFWDKWGFIEEHIHAMADWSMGHPTLAAALAVYNDESKEEE